METKHTPGPWKQYRDSRGNVRIQGNVAGGPVAFIEEMNNTGGTPQDHANARLIAAAPELLEELSKLANKVFGYCHGEPSEEDRLRIIALIAKATTPNT